MRQEQLPITGDYATCGMCSIGHRIYRIGRLSFVTHSSGVPQIVAVAPAKKTPRAT